MKAKITMSLVTALAVAGAFADDFLTPKRTADEVVVFTATPAGDARIDRTAWWSSANSKITAAYAGGTCPHGTASAVVELPDGDYVSGSCWTLPAKVSGTENAPLVIRARNAHAARMRGSRIVDTNRFAAITASDPNWSRFQPSARSSILVQDATWCLTNSSSGYKCEEWPSRTRRPAKPWLFVGGRFQDLARWPNRPSGDNGYGWTNYEYCVRSDGNGTNIVLRLAGDRAKNWDLGLARFHGLSRYFWHDEYIQASAYTNTAAHPRELSISEGFLADREPLAETPAKQRNQSRRYVVLNEPYELDAPGEWWLDRDNRLLYYIPGPGFGSEEMALNNAAYCPFVFNTGLHDVRIEGIDFAYYSYLVECGTAVTNITFENCSFESVIGATRLKGKNIRFRNCTFSHFGGGGLFGSAWDGKGYSKDVMGGTLVFSTGGDRTTLESSGHVIENCTFSDFQHLQFTTAPAIYMACTGMGVRRCTFSNAAHEAIKYIGNEHLIGWCRFDRLLRETADAGAVYTGQSAASLGTKIIGCSFTNIQPSPTSLIPDDETRVAGIYFDDGDWGDDIIGCSFENCRRGIFFRGGNLHNICWNEIDDATTGITVDRCIADGTAGSLSGRTPMEWIADSLSPCDATCGYWHAAYPTLVAATNTMPAEPWNNAISGNLLTSLANCIVDKSVTGEGPVPCTNNVTDAEGTDHVGFRVVPGAGTGDVAGLAEAQRRAADFANAPVVELARTNGTNYCRVRFGLDATGRLCCRAETNGVDLVLASPIGTSVNGVDYGRLAKPARVTRLLSNSGLTARITLEDVLTGVTDACIDVRVYSRGFAASIQVKASKSTADWAGDFQRWNVAGGATPYLTTSSPSSYTTNFASQWYKCGGDSDFENDTTIEPKRSGIFIWNANSSGKWADETLWLDPSTTDKAVLDKTLE